MNHTHLFGEGDSLKNKYLLGILLLLILTVTGVSYAYWNLNYQQQNSNIASTNCFELTFNDNTEAINLTNIVPTEDEEGLKEKGYSFTIKNTCNTIATYEVNLEDILASSNTKQLPNKYIKVSLNDGTPKVLNTYEEVKPTIEEATNSFKLTSGSLKPDEEATYELKLWMDSETPAIDEVMSATFESKITVNTSYIEEENLANDITIIATSQNEDYSKEKEIFTIDITSTNKNIIEYSYNKQNWTSVTPTKDLTIEKEYTKEGSYPIYIKDEVGNVKEYIINTAKLDQTAPERTIEETNNHESYLLKITMTDAKSGIASYQITESKETPTEWLDYISPVEKEIDKNGIYYIWSKDKVGNMNYEAYSVTLIDKEAPKIVLTNTLTDWGAKDTINIHLTDDIIGLSGYQVTTTEEEPTSFITIENTLDTTITYDVTKSGTYYVYAKDAYNHISHEKIVIDKVDDKVPVISNITNSSNGEWTKEDVTTTISAYDNETAVSKYQIKYSGNDNTWTDMENNTSVFDSDMDETVYYRVIDMAGNISEEKSTVIKIDKTTPATPSITNSKENTWTGSDLPITLTSSDAGSGIDHFEWYENGAWTTRVLTMSGNTGTITYTVTRNETIRFRVIDKVGNISEEGTTVVKIDKTKPTQSFSVASSTSGSNGWYKALSIKVSTTDSHSGVASSKYCITTGSSCTPSMAAILSSNAYTVDLGTDVSAQKVCVNTTDKVGNVSDTTCSSAYSVDNVNPTAKISASLSGTSITVRASGSKDQESGIATYYYSKDGGSTFVSSTSSSYTFTGLTLGNTYTMALKVMDKTGNISSIATSSDFFISGLATSIIKTLVTGASTSSSDVYTSPSKTSSTCTYTFAYDNTSDNNLRYVGKKPCNYVTFNGETAGWRIIGILNTPEGQRLKLIRANSIGNYYWDNKPSGTGSSTSDYGSNDWTDSLLKEVLNNGAYYNRTSGQCPYGSIGATKACDFTSNGLTEVARKQIDTITWKLGGAKRYYGSSTSNWYTYERGATVYKGRPTEWKGKVGLMYLSDHGYATSGGSTTNRSSCLATDLNDWVESSYSDCNGNDWLYDSRDNQKILTPSSFYSDTVFYFLRNGHVFSTYVTYSAAIRPSVYLVSSTSILNGEGTPENPYVLSVQ